MLLEVTRRAWPLSRSSSQLSSLLSCVLPHKCRLLCVLLPVRLIILWRWTRPSCPRSGMRTERASLDTFMESPDQVGNCIAYTSHHHHYQTPNRIAIMDLECTYNPDYKETGTLKNVNKNRTQSADNVLLLLCHPIMILSRSSLNVFHLLSVECFI